MSALSDRIARLVADAIAGEDVYCELEDVTREVDEMCARTVSAPVDVLAVLREFATRKSPFGSTEQAVRKYEAARAAVAEVYAQRDALVEALRYAVDNPDFDSERFDALARATLARVQGEKA